MAPHCHRLCHHHHHHHHQQHNPHQFDNNHEMVRACWSASLVLAPHCSRLCHHHYHHHYHHHHHHQHHNPHQFDSMHERGEGLLVCQVGIGAPLQQVVREDKVLAVQGEDEGSCLRLRVAAPVVWVLQVPAAHRLGAKDVRQQRVVKLPVEVYLLLRQLLYPVPLGHRGYGRYMKLVLKMHRCAVV